MSDNMADVTDLRRMAERHARREPRLAEPLHAWGRCVIESADLVREHNRRRTGSVTAMFVRACGVNYPGRQHWAAIAWDERVEVEDMTVADVTARQFDADAPTPWVGSLLDWYDAAVDWLGDHIAVEFYSIDPHAPLGIADEPFWRDRYDDRDDVDPHADRPWPWETVSA